MQNAAQSAPSMDSPQRLIDAHFRESAIQFEIEPPPNPDTLRGLPGATNAVVDAGEVIVYSEDIPATMSAILRFAGEASDTGQVKHLSVRRATLEDVFLKLTGRKIRE